jgi:hypothetical protein
LTPPDPELKGGRFQVFAFKRILHRYTEAATLKPIGAHTALLPEASDAGSNAAFIADDASGDVAFPHGGAVHVASTRPIAA